MVATSPERREAGNENVAQCLLFLHPFLVHVTLELSYLFPRKRRVIFQFSEQTITLSHHLALANFLCILLWPFRFKRQSGASKNSLVWAALYAMNIARWPIIEISLVASCEKNVFPTFRHRAAPDAYSVNAIFVASTQMSSANENETKHDRTIDRHRNIIERVLSRSFDETWRKKQFSFGLGASLRHHFPIPHVCGESIRRGDQSNKNARIRFFAFFRLFFFFFSFSATIEIRQTFSITQNAFLYTHTLTRAPNTHTHARSYSQCPVHIVAHRRWCEWVSALDAGCMGARLCAARIRVIVYVPQCRRLRRRVSVCMRASEYWTLNGES